VELIEAGPTGLYAFNKPSGIRSQPKAGGKDPQALLTCSYSLKDEAYHVPPDKGGGKVWLLHRLDAGTSGVILVADQKTTAEEVKKGFAEHRVKKTYVALVFGWPKESEAVWRDRIEVTKEGGRARGKTGAGIWAEARMRIREKFQGKSGPMALLELQPKTGRTHQLRIQCANRGLPIVGDRTYGDFQKNRALKTDVLFLHSESITCPVGKAFFKPHMPHPEEFKFLG
jgi:23S rRNA-/tRNA-specific pseudouridylate synthase